MELNEYTFRVNELDVTPEAIEMFIGYEPGNSPGYVRTLIEETLQQAGDLCQIKGGYVIYDNIHFEPADYSLHILDREFSIKKIICNQIKKSDSVALFACTAGSGIGEQADKLIARGDGVEGYIMDITGSQIVEAAMDKMQDDLEKKLALKNLFITNRYSPGYCGWNISEQQKLFSLLPPRFCGITLSDHSLMNPVKSVSGIIGIGNNVRRKNYACSICEMANCIYRNKKSNPA